MPDNNKVAVEHKIVFYIDGLNLYYAFNKKNWEELNWLDIVKFCSANLPPNTNCTSLTIKYYTSKFEQHSRNGKAQLAFIQANEKINENNTYLKIIQGIHKSGSSWCDICKTDTPKMNEKQTDVNIALDMLHDAVIGKVCNVSVLISNDTDLVPSIKMIRKSAPLHRVVILVPPTQNVNYDLQHAVKNENEENVIVFRKNEYTRYLNAKLDEEIIINAHNTIHRPDIYNQAFLTEERQRKKKEEKDKLKAAKSEYKNLEAKAGISEELIDLQRKFKKD